MTHKVFSEQVSQNSYQNSSIYFKLIERLTYIFLNGVAQPTYQFGGLLQENIKGQIPNACQGGLPEFKYIFFWGVTVLKG